MSLNFETFKPYDETDPYAPIDDDLFLSAIPESLLEETIKKQFDDPLEYRKSDYVQNFLNKYYFSRREAYEEEEEGLEQLREDFVSFIQAIFYDYLGIGFPNLEDMPEEDQHDMIHKVYRFFIMQIKKNFTNLIWSYINEDPDIDSVLEHTENIIYNNFKKEINNERDILLITNLPSVVEYVLTKDISVDEFFDHVIDDNASIEAFYVQDQFDNFNLTGNFVGNYITMVDDVFKIELETKIKNRILKKYPKRKNEDSTLQDADIEEKENTDAEENNTDTE